MPCGLAASSSWIAFSRTSPSPPLPITRRMPNFLASAMTAGMLFTVWSKIGTLGRTLEISRAARRPFSPDIARSKMITSGLSSRAFRWASSPSIASPQTVQPGRDSMSSLSNFRTTSLPSAIRIRVIPNRDRWKWTAFLSRFETGSVGNPTFNDSESSRLFKTIQEIGDESSGGNGKDEASTGKTGLRPIGDVLTSM